MKITIGFKDKLLRVCFSLTFFFILIFQTNFQILSALPMNNYSGETVIEELRLKVPAYAKTAWLNAENEIWEPWLSSQDGYLGRQLYWNKEKEEALILVNWKSRKLWKSIPMSEVNVIQENFEENVKTALNVSDNPFRLIYEGELSKQR